MKEIENIKLEFLKIEDYNDLKEAMVESYSNMPEAFWKEHHIKKLVTVFPEGQVAIKINNEFAGCALSIIVDYEKFDNKHTYREITGNYAFDTQNGYSRVRSCAQARAIENECFVAIAGSVGNLPKVHNMDIQYAQSMVFTPCDFAFPTNGIKAEATPNTEMILIADVDIDMLRELTQFGSVRNLKDRRTDLYKVLKMDQKTD